MAKEKQNIFKSFAWPVAVAIVAGIVGVLNHAPGAAYFTGGFIWAVGVIYLAVLYADNNETTMVPYIAHAIGAAITMIWACVG